MNLVCPKCNNSIFNRELKEKGVLQCDYTDKDNKYCGELVGAICKTCNAPLPFNRFGKHGDVYECKECGRVNWPLTDYLREQEEEIARIKKEIERAQSWSRSLSEWINK